MGIMEWLTQPATSGAAGQFNEANKHWRMRQAALLAGDDGKQREELLEVIVQCEDAIRKDQKEGNAYVLLANALVCACDLGDVSEEDRDILRRCAAGVIHKWWTLPRNKYPITKDYDLGVRFHERVLGMIEAAEHCSKEQATTRMAEYGAEYGGHAAFLANYDRIKAAVLGVVAESGAQTAGAPVAAHVGTNGKVTAVPSAGKSCQTCGRAVSKRAKYCEQCRARVEGRSKHSEGELRTNQEPKEEDQDELWKMADRVRFYVHANDLRMLGELLPEDRTVKALRRDYPDGGMIEVRKRVYEELVRKASDLFDAQAQYGVTSFTLQNAVEVMAMSAEPRCSWRRYDDEED